MAAYQGAEAQARSVLLKANRPRNLFGGPKKRLFGNLERIDGLAGF
jgi:hypothetical protein